MRRQVRAEEAQTLRVVDLHAALGEEALYQSGPQELLAVAVPEVWG